MRWAVVPARFGSTRLPGKVLADLGGQPMLAHVLERVRTVDRFDRILVATDDDRVAAAATGLRADVVRTGPARSGTHRAALAVGAARVEVVVVQADQPLLDPVHLRVLVDTAEHATVTTLVAPLDGDPSDPARVKVTLDASGRAADFSRRPIPAEGPWLVHHGLYAFQRGFLARCAAAPASPRSVEEDLEQLAWLAAGFTVTVAEVDRCPPAVDTPGDLERVRRILNETG